MGDLCVSGPAELNLDLSQITTPSRYLGGERNQIVKDLSQIDVRFGLGFPDSYEVGMSHLGLKILYHILNELPFVAAERVFTPWVDRVFEMQRKSEGLTTLENHIPLKELDALGVSIQYELAATNLLLMLELGGVPIHRTERDMSATPRTSTWTPLVIGGGPVTFNPEPLSDFFDAFVIGEGEEVIHQVALVLQQGVIEKKTRGDILEQLSKVQGIYIPEYYESIYGENGRLFATRPIRSGVSARIKRRVVKDLDETPFPTKPIVPFMNIIHDRVAVEIQRGCTRGCRFCQAGMIYRPTRQRSPEKVRSLLRESLRNTGYEEASLMSLSNGDYGPLNDLLTAVMPELQAQNVAISLPSMRVDTLKKSVADQIKKVRKTGFTLAPEVGSAKMRKIINKGINEEDVLKATRDAFEAGWRQLKFYFMIGLPLESDEDIIAIAELAKKAQDSCGNQMAVTVSASTHSPKPHTPFQWARMDTHEEILRKQKLLKSECHKRKIKSKLHSPEMTMLEGVFARGDRRLGKLFTRAYRAGLIYAAWDDQFDFEKWQIVLKEWSEEINVPLSYWFDPIPEDSWLPWDHIDCGVTKEWLLKDWLDAKAQVEVPDCAIDGPCTDCGGCEYDRDVINRVYSSFQAPPQTDQLFPVISERVEGVQSRLRIQYEKIGKARFMGHLEVTRVFSRILRQIGLPMKFSEGFHPMPRLVFCPPVTLGTESFDEWLDVTLEAIQSQLDLENLKNQINEKLPEGFRVKAARFLGVAEPTVAQSVIGAKLETRLQVLGSSDGILNEMKSRVEKALIQEELIVSKINSEGRPKVTNVRPFLSDLSIDESESGDAILKLSLRYTPQGTLRPQEFVDHCLGLPANVKMGHWTKTESLGMGSV